MTVAATRSAATISATSFTYSVTFSEAVTGLAAGDFTFSGTSSGWSVTGVSGSGKSSLAFDTIYAEGQRRYVESLSAYARQFLEQMEKPDVEEILGLAPPIAIRQKNTTRNPRSTVATSTEIHDFLRLLYARAGTTYCSQCGDVVRRDTVDVVAEAMSAEAQGSRWYALFPVQADKDPAKLRDHLFELRRKGFNRLYQNGQVFEFSTPESLLEIDFAKRVFVLAELLPNMLILTNHRGPFILLHTNLKDAQG